MNIDHDHSPHGQVSIGSGSSSDVGSYVQKIMGTSREGSTALCANLAQDLNQLSFQERCAVYEEIHGVDPQLEEKEEMLNSKLSALEDEIARFSIKPAYELSMKMSHVYVTSRKFRLMFLRAESMDPAKAAIRLIKFMELKLQYFGPGSLARPICSNDLDSDDLSTLKAGRLQVLPEKDRSGRAVIGTFLNLTSLLPCKDPASMARILAFLYLSVIENDEEVQRKGTVVILYFIGDVSFDWNVRFQQSVGAANILLEWLPGKFKSVHLCTHPNSVDGLSQLITQQLHPTLRVRFRVHSFESQMECHNQLMTFGIPVHAIPVTTGMKLKTGTHFRWMAKQRARDASMLRTGDFSGIDLPGSHDILLGRGKTFQQHLGNQAMRSLVRESLSRYIEADRITKTNIACELVARIKQEGSRFLARSDDGWWSEVVDNLAREKVSVCFRTFLSHKQQKAQISDNFI